MGIFKNTLQDLQGGQHDYLDNQEVLVGYRVGYKTLFAVYRICFLPLFQLFHHSLFPFAMVWVQTV